MQCEIKRDSFQTESPKPSTSWPTCKFLQDGEKENVIKWLNFLFWERRHYHYSWLYQNDRVCYAALADLKSSSWILVCAWTCGNSLNSDSQALALEAHSFMSDFFLFFPFLFLCFFLNKRFYFVLKLHIDSVMMGKFGWQEQEDCWTHGIFRGTVFILCWFPHC